MLIQTFAGLLLGISTNAVSREKASWIGRMYINPIKWIIRIYPLAMICAFLTYMNSDLNASIHPILVLLFAFTLSIVFSMRDCYRVQAFLTTRLYIGYET